LREFGPNGLQLQATDPANASMKRRDQDAEGDLAAKRPAHDRRRGSRSGDDPGAAMTATVTGKRGNQYLVDLGDGTGQLYDADEDNPVPAEERAHAVRPALLG
jgi:hypothetical protein